MLRRNTVSAKRLFVAMGALLLLAAVFAHPLGLSATPSMSMGKLMLFLAGSTFLVFGFLKVRLYNFYISVAIVLLNTCVLLFLVEAGLFVATFVSDRFASSQAVSKDRGPEANFIDGEPMRLSYYQAQPWSKQYLKEYERAWEARTPPYRPYVLWRSSPFRGDTVNITQEGWRLTPGSECSVGSYRIFMFGGSTMWGTGVPDWGTIPAHLQAALAQRLGARACVMNLGEQAYVSTQSLIQLVLELQVGNIPDLVVFYDGINDVFATYQSGAAGVHQNLGRIAARFEKRAEIPPIVALLAQTRTFKAAYKIVKGRKYEGQLSPTTVPDFEVAELALGIKRVYSKNERIVAALGRQFGFDHLFFWQPVLILDEKNLAHEELAMKKLVLAVHPKVRDFFSRAYGEIYKLSRERNSIHYLASIFKDEVGLVYVDPWHVTVEGNRRIALEMLRLIDPLMGEAIPEQLDADVHDLPSGESENQLRATGVENGK